MATIDLTQGAVTSGLVSENDTGKQVFIQRTRDFGVAANSVNASDVLQMIPVPAGFFLMGGMVETQTVEWGTATQCQLGDGADPNGLLGTANCNLNSTSTDVTRGYSQLAGANTLTTVNAYAAQGGKYYPVADTIDMIPANTLNAAKVRVGVWGFMGKPGDSIAQ